MAQNDPLIQEFVRAIEDCRKLYRESGQLIAMRYPELAWKDPAAMIELMDDLHAGLLIKTYFSIALADRKWTATERQLCQLLIEHIWKRKLDGNELRDTAYRLSGQANTLGWFGLVRPFAEVAPLRERVASLEAIVARVANVVAKIDGEFSDSEERILRSIQQELELHLRPLSLEGTARQPEIKHFDVADFAAESLSTTGTDERPHDDRPPAAPEEAVESLEQLLAELDALVGLVGAKHEVKTLANLLQLQQHRERQGLPRTDVSLHMVFTGNPGTGKTTVARLVGSIFRAMGILKRGHLIETDRSGLVAEYAGQTGPKTNQCIDDAIDGVLFVDEAYSLLGERDDAFGREAIQTLLKRMEDDRDRLVVILAGYPQPMQELLVSNPGLSSRFNRKLRFEDYEPIELSRIFGGMCEQNHFEISGPVRARLLVAFDWLYQQRDAHFGNGRTVRNLFESAVRRMANRIAGAKDISKELLTQFEPSDLQFNQISEQFLDARMDTTRFRVNCPGCNKPTLVEHGFLGQTVQCKCTHTFVVEWGNPMC